MSPRYLYLSSAFAWLVLIILLSLTGAPPEIKNPLLGWDKLQHATAYAVLTCLLTRGLLTDQRHVLRALVISIIFSSSIGVLMEIGQGMIQNGRQADPQDALANALGACAAGWIYWLITARLTRLRSWAVIWATVLFLLLTGTGSAQAVDAPQIIADAQGFFMALPPAAAAMVTFPVNSDAGGQWWTLTALGALGASYANDESIRRRLQDSRSAELDHAADVGSFVGNPVVHLGLVAGIYTGGYLVGRDDWRAVAIKAGEALFLADSVTLVAKEAIGRARPDTGGDRNSFHSFRFNGRDDSLPSLHTASSFALATVFAGETDNNYLAMAYYLGATGVGVSRMIQDRHWASDVILGAAIGGLSGWSVRQSARKKETATLTIMPLALNRGAGAAVVGVWQ